MRITERDVEHKIYNICVTLNEMTNRTRHGVTGHYHMSWNGNIAFSSEGSTGEEIVIYISGSTKRERYDCACSISDTLFTVKEYI